MRDNLINLGNPDFRNLTLLLIAPMTHCEFPVLCRIEQHSRFREVPSLGGWKAREWNSDW